MPVGCCVRRRLVGKFNTSSGNAIDIGRSQHCRYWNEQQFTATVAGISSNAVTGQYQRLPVAAKVQATSASRSIQHAISSTCHGHSHGYQCHHDHGERQCNSHGFCTGHGDRPALAVDVDTPNTPSENPHAINPYVYGMNAYVLDPASQTTANPSITRWGGDNTSRYNYQNEWSNSAADWYFENGPASEDGMPGDGTFSS